MLPQMAKPHKSDKTYSADESFSRGENRTAKDKFKKKENKKKITTMNGSSELIKSQTFQSMRIF